MNRLYRTFIIPIAILIVIGAAGQQTSRSKKIIEWGWDDPRTAFVRANIDKVEKLPFDGVVFTLRHADGKDVTWTMWGSTRLDYANLAHMVDDLTHTPFKSLTERFIRVNVTPGNVDWFDDEAWNSVLHNFQVAARVAKAGNCKGFVFDLETYETKTFNLKVSVAMHDALAEEHRGKVRQRGRELIGAVSKEFPDIVILFPWAYRLAEYVNYPLAPDFLDGMLEASPKTVRLVDIGEVSYAFKKAGEFKKAYKIAKQDAAKISAFPDRYKAKIEAGFGIWIDNEWQQFGWRMDEMSKNYFSPREFMNSVAYALQASDEYVWIYSNNLNWWTGKNLPPDYIDALRSAKERN